MRIIILNYFFPINLDRIGRMYNQGPFINLIKEKIEKLSLFTKKNIEYTTLMYYKDLILRKNPIIFLDATYDRTLLKKGYYVIHIW